MAKTTAPVVDEHPGMVICSDQDCRDWATRVKKPHKHTGKQKE